MEKKPSLIVSGLKIGAVLAVIATIGDVLTFPTSYKLVEYLAYGGASLLMNFVVWVIVAIVVIWFVRLIRRSV